MTGDASVGSARGRTLVLLVGLLLGTHVVLASPAAAFDVDVVVTITEVEALDEVDPPSGDADFYTRTTIDGALKQSDPCAFEDAGDLVFPNWQLSQPVDINNTDVVAIEIELWDDDGTCPGGGDVPTGDEQLDVDPDQGRALDLLIDLQTCTVSGEVTGSCDASIQVTGDSVGDDNGRMVFSVTVVEPPSAPGLTIRCTHTPLVAGTSPVTVTADVLNPTSLNPKAADTVEIYITELAGGTTPPPPSGSPATSATFNQQLTHIDGPFPDGFAYGCRAVDDGVPVFSGWRTVAPATVGGQTIQAVGVTGPVVSRLDMVLVADGDNYAGGMDPTFLSHAADVIVDGYWDLNVFLVNQDRFNFWVAPGAGDAEEFDETCPHVAPPGWNQVYAFADVGVILHTDEFRDCATGSNSLYSAEFDSFATLRHETGHQPFGLADEYCDQRAGTPSDLESCDGGYWQNDVNPNVYESFAACNDDLAALGNMNCQSFTSESDGGTWFVSDPPFIDLMVDNRAPQAADRRRINWMFDECAQARC